MFWMRHKENSFPIRSLIWRPDHFHISAGFKFYKSENGVILSTGDSNGYIPKKYFKRIYDRHSSKLYLELIHVCLVRFRDIFTSSGEIFIHWCASV